MAASGANLRSEQVTLYHSTTAPSAATYAGVSAQVTSGNLIGNVMDITPPAQVRGTYTRSPMGDDVNTPVPGRIDLGELTFSVYLDNSNTKHATFLDDAKTTDAHWIVSMNTGSSAITLYYFTGFITDAHIVTPNDGLAMLEVTVAVTNEAISVDQS